jgi:hypothetical protein
MTIFSKGTENITIFFFKGIFHIKEENEEFDKIPDNSILKLHTGTISFLLIPLRVCRGRDHMMVVKIELSGILSNSSFSSFI